jgi:hypothetical protein
MALKELDRPTLKEIGIAPLGPVIKIHGLIRALIENSKLYFICDFL